MRCPSQSTRWARRIVGVLTIAAVLTSLGSAPALASTYRSRMLRMFNAARVNHDLKPVKLNLRLSGDATAHTRKMINKDRLAHVSNLKDVLDPYEWEIGGAIVGCGSSLAAIHKAFMQSAVHHDIILVPGARRVGIGVIRTDGDSSCGEDAFWVTAIFYG
ncbi:MAG: CAP domain-containing protein [Actinomycetota bacterium]